MKATLSNPAWGALGLRVSLGLVLLAHSVYLKGLVFTLPGTATFFQSLGLPGLLAYVVFAVEAVAGVALILGVRTRLFSLLVVPILLGATWAHWQSGWLFTNTGGGWEYPLFLTAAALVQANLGDGALGLRRHKQSIQDREASGMRTGNCPGTKSFSS